MSRGNFFCSISCIVLATVALSGCTRGHYRLRADADAYGRITEKSNFKPWQVPSTYSVYPAPHSRLHDPTCVNDPHLPSPSPQLYDYELPELPERDLARFRPNSDSDGVITDDLFEDVPAREEPVQPEATGPLYEVDSFGAPPASVVSDLSSPAPSLSLIHI